MSLGLYRKELHYVVSVSFIYKLCSVTPWMSYRISKDLFLLRMLIMLINVFHKNLFPELVKRNIYYRITICYIDQIGLICFTF